jgi:tetratricopeptide (TPR) repeat protein
MEPWDERFDEANGHLAIGELTEAAQLYRECVALKPDFFDAWHALGMTLMKLGQLKEAIGCGLQATTLKPNDLLYVKDGQIAEAEAAKGNARILSLGGKVLRD